MKLEGHLCRTFVSYYGTQEAIISVGDVDLRCAFLVHGHVSLSWPPHGGSSIWAYYSITHISSALVANSGHAHHATVTHRVLAVADSSFSHLVKWLPHQHIFVALICRQLPPHQCLLIKPSGRLPEGQSL